MPFANYQSVADVARPFRIYVQRAHFVLPLAIPLSDTFRAELDFTLREVPFDGSEAALHYVFRQCRDQVTRLSATV